MLKWFTTIPGILILCGVILLVIAIVLFILGNKKEKKEKNVNTGSNDLNNNNLIQGGMAAVTPVNEVPVQSFNQMEGQAIITDSPIQDINQIDTSVVAPSVTPVAPVIDFTPASQETIVPDVPVVEPISNETPVEPAAEVNPVQDFGTINIEPVVDKTINTMEPITTNEVQIPTPEVNILSPVTQEPVVEETSEYDFTLHYEEPEEETPVTIYGGNNPLENTQPAEEIHHEPYSGIPEVKIVEPTTTPVVDIQPVVQDIPTISMPEVQETPVINEEVVSEIKIEEPTPIVTEEPSIEIPVQPTPVVEMNSVEEPVENKTEEL